MVVIAILVLLVAQQVKPPASTAAGEISAGEAAEQRDQGAFILDVREPSEWVLGHISGSTLIPLRDLSDRLAEVPRDREVVVVCQSGVRSLQARDYLLDIGYHQVVSLKGGLTGWVTQGLPVVKGQ